MGELVQGYWSPLFEGPRRADRQRYRVFAAPAVLDLYAAVDAELVTPPTPATSPPGLGL